MNTEHNSQGKTTLFLVKTNLTVNRPGVKIP